MNATDIASDYGFTKCPTSPRNYIGTQKGAEDMVRTLINSHRQTAKLLDTEWQLLKQNYPPSRMLNDAGFGTLPGEDSHIVIGSEYEFSTLDKFIAIRYTVENAEAIMAGKQVF